MLLSLLNASWQGHRNCCLSLTFIKDRRVVSSIVYKGLDNADAFFFNSSYLCFGSDKVPACCSCNHWGHPLFLWWRLQFFRAWQLFIQTKTLKLSFWFFAKLLKERTNCLQYYIGLSVWIESLQRGLTVIWIQYLLEMAPPCTVVEKREKETRFRHLVCWLPWKWRSLFHQMLLLPLKYKEK